MWCVFLCIIAFRYLGPESLKRQVAKLFDRLARFTLKKSSLFVERQSERQKGKPYNGRPQST